MILLQNTVTFLCFVTASLAISPGFARASDVSVKEIAKLSFANEFGAVSDKGWSGHVYYTSPMLSKSGSNFLSCVSSDVGAKCFNIDSNGKILWSYPAKRGEKLQLYPIGAFETKSGKTVVTTASGRVLFLNGAGELQREVQIVDPELLTLPKDSRAFRYASLGLDGESVFVPSSSGLITKVTDAGATPFTHVKCVGDSGQKATCFFWGPFVARADGTMAISESSRVLTLSSDGQTHQSIPAKYDAKISLSQDGSAFVVAYEGTPRGKFRGEVMILPPSGESKTLTVDAQTTPQAYLQADGTLIVTAYTYGNDGKIKHYLGLKAPTESQIRLSQIEEATDFLNSRPVSDGKGRIYLGDLSGKFYVLNDKAAVQTTILNRGEFREPALVLANGRVVTFNEGDLNGSVGSIRIYEITAMSASDAEKQSRGDQANAALITALDQYETQADVDAVGACDPRILDFSNPESVVFHRQGQDFEMYTVRPPGAYGAEFVMVKKQSGTDYFVVNHDGQKRQVEKLTGGAWGSRLQSLSPGFYIYAFVPSQKSNCMISKIRN